MAANFRNGKTYSSSFGRGESVSQGGNSEYNIDEHDNSGFTPVTYRHKSKPLRENSSDFGREHKSYNSDSHRDGYGSRGGSRGGFRGGSRGGSRDGSRGGKSVNYHGSFGMRVKNPSAIK